MDRVARRHEWLLVPAFVFCASAARGDVGYFAGSGQDIVLAQTAQVQMVSEDVSILVRPDSAEYRCVFELRNLSGDPLDVQAGFPLNGDWYEGAMHAGSDIVDGKQSCDQPEVEIVADDYRFIARDEDATYHVRYVRHDAEQRFTRRWTC